MPVDRLLVEGRLDADIWRSFLGGVPEVVAAGPKYDLPRQARVERPLRQVNVSYVRDRDFDHDPPADLTEPTVDRWHGDGSVLGWRWCRHEIENYLLDPAIVSAALSWDEAAYGVELSAAARAIRCYQTARWAVGTARRSLPPQYALRTRPEECGNDDSHLPADLTEPSTAAWTRNAVTGHGTRIGQALDAAGVEATRTTLLGQFSDPFLAVASHVLVWCSGKDLLAALEPWLHAQHQSNAGALRAGFAHFYTSA